MLQPAFFVPPAGFRTKQQVERQRNPFEGTGGPEPLRYNWKGYWSRRINKEHRFVYKAKKDELLIAQCRYHY